MTAKPAMPAIPKDRSNLAMLTDASRATREPVGEIPFPPGRR